MSAGTPHGGMAGPSHGYGGASTRHGGMAGPSHGYSGYGGPSGYFQMPFHAGGQHMSQPARHFTSSMSGFAGGPYADGPPNLLPHMLPSYGPYGEGSSHGGRVHRSHASPSWHSATMRDEDNALESSSGDNAAIVGDAVAVEEEASEGSMAGQGEGSSSDGDLDWSSADDSSDEDYEELCKVLGDAYGNYEDYEELYKVLDDAYGDEEPAVIQAIKQFSWNLRSALKLLKEAVLQGMHEESINRKLRRQNRKLRRQNRW